MCSECQEYFRAVAFDGEGAMVLFVGMSVATGVLLVLAWTWWTRRTAARRREERRLEREQSTA
ncbi:MAG: hypothetical protein ACYTDX_04395 [Planctomycetota bacterium]